MSGVQFNITLGETVPIRVTHPLRLTGKFPRARITDLTGSPVPSSPFALTDEGNGYYSLELPALLLGQFYGQVDFYNDAGFTILSPEVQPLAFNISVTETVTQVDRLHTDYTTARAGLIDNCDVAVSTRESESDAATRAATDVAEHNATQALIGTPVGTVSSDIAAVQATADAIETDTQDIQTRIGTPVGTVSSDIAAVKADTVQIIADIAALNDPTAAQIADAVWDEALAGHTLVGSTGEAQNRLAGIQADAAELNDTKITTARANNLDNLDATVSSRESEADASTRAATDLAEHNQTQADIAALQDLSIADVQTALTNQGYTAGRAPNLDNLDATVSSRQSETDALSRFNSLITEHNDTQASIAALNNPSAAAIADAVWDEALADHVAVGSMGANQNLIDDIESDTSGLRADITTPRAANLDNLDATVSSRATQTSVDNIQNNTRFSMVVPELLKKPDTGTKDYKFYGRLFNTSGAPEDPDANNMNIRLEQTDGTVVVATVAMVRTGVGEYEYTYTVNASDTEQVLVVFVEYDESSVAYQQIRTTEVVEFETKLDSIQSDVTAIKAQTDQFTFTGSNVNANAQVVSDKTGYTLTSGDKDIIADRVWDEALADHVAVGSMGANQNLIDDIESDTSGLRADYTTPRATNLDNLNATITSRQSESDALTRFNALITEHNQTQADIAALNNPSAAAIADAVWDEALADHATAGSMGANQNLIDDIESDTSGLRADYTTPRAANLDNLDTTVSSRQSDANALARYNDLVSEHNQTQSDIAALENLSIADVQTALDNQGYTTARATAIDNLDATVSSRESEVDAGTRQAALISEHNQTQADIAALENLSIADVQTALDNQGYTSARAGLIDNLDVAVSTRESTADAAVREANLIAEHNQTQADIAALNDPTAAAIADAVWDETRASHVTVGTFGESLQGVLSVVRANNLDNLDVTVSSRESEASANTRAIADQAEHAQTQSDIASLSFSSSPAAIADAVWDEARADHTAAGSFGEGAQGVVSIARANNLDFLDVSVLSRASQASVDNIESIGRFTGVVPFKMIKDLSGPKVYTLYGKLFDINGNPNDPDGDDMFIRIEEPDGTVVVSTTTMTRTSAGQYEFDYTVLPSDPERALLVFFTYVENTISFEQIKSSEVTDEDSKLDTLLNRLTAPRAANLDNLDVAVSTRESEASADARHLADLGEHNSTQAVLANVDTNATQIKAKTDQFSFFGGNVRARAEVVVDKTGYSLAAGQIASIADAVWDELQSAHTLPGTFGRYLDDQVSLKEDEADAASRAAVDLAEHNATQATLATVSANAVAIKAKTDNLSFTGTNVRSEVQTNLDKTGYALTVGEKDDIVDRVWDEPNAAHLIAGSTGENLANAGGAASPATIADAVWDELRAGHTIVGSFGQAIQGVITTTRANNLDNLDATISSRASQASVDLIQNNTRFIGVVPTSLVKPVSGTKNYKIYARLFNTAGTPEDPDLLAMTIRIELVDSTVIVPTASMARTGVGLYEYTYAVNAADLERPLNVFFEYEEAGTPFQHVRVTEVAEFESKLDTLLARLTAPRASNLDNLDVTISSRQSEANALVRFNSLDTDIFDARAEIAGVQTSVNDVEAKVDTVDTVVDGIKAKTDLLNFNGPNVLAEAAVITDKNDYALSIAAQDAVVDRVWDELLASHVIVGSAGEVLSRVDVDLSTRAAAIDLAAVAVQVDRLDTDYTTARAANLDNLDATISSRATQVSVDALPTVAQIADGVWDEPIADHLTAGSTGESLNDAGGSTSPSAIADAVWDEARADHVAPGSFGEALDVPVSTRATQVSVDAIPTNPVLDTDPRLNNLDTPISSVSGGGGGEITPEITGTVTESEDIGGTVQDADTV